MVDSFTEWEDPQAPLSSSHGNKRYTTNSDYHPSRETLDRREREYKQEVKNALIWRIIGWSLLALFMIAFLFLCIFCFLNPQLVHNPSKPM